MEEPEVCSICFQNYSQERKPMIICQDGHSICEVCLKTANGCPFCRTSFDEFKPILNRSLLQIIKRYSLEPKKKNIPFIPLSELEVEQKPFAVGGTAQIFKAKWKGKDVIIKRMMFLNDEKANEQFENELKLAMKVEHPSIIKMYGKTEMDNLMGIVIEFANQGDLSNNIPSLTFEEQIDYSLQIIEGIKLLHSNSIIHRDLKPENILVFDNHPKIADFGISKAREHTLKVTSPKVSYRYSALELYQEGSVYDTSCDIFSLSMILYEIFSKKKPFGSENPMMIPVKVIQGQRPEFPNDFPKDLAEVIKKGWSSNPKERCTLNEFTQCLERMKPENSRVIANNTNQIHSPPQAVIKKTFGIAQYDFEARESNELSFSFGDELEILDQYQEGWAYALLNGKKGYAPLNYLKLVEKSVQQFPQTNQTNQNKNQISQQFSNLNINKVDIEKELKLLDDEFNKSDYKNKTKNGATLLHYFAQKEPINKDLFNHFINSRVDWNKQDEYRWSPVHYLCRNKSITFDMIKLLVDNGANFNLNGRWPDWPELDFRYDYTPLHDLCKNTSITKEMIELLFDKGADFHIQYKDERYKKARYESPLHYLCKNKSITTDIIRILINKGVNFNLQIIYGYKRESPLHYLCQNSSITEEMIKLLKGTNADFNLKNELNNKTPKDLLPDSLKKMI